MILRFDRSTPEESLKSIAEEGVRAEEAQALLEARLAAVEERSVMAHPAGAPHWTIVIDSDASGGRMRWKAEFRHDWREA
jgi:hypothetical protein